MKNRIYKPEIIKVNLSETFMTRSRCKECSRFPSIYYYVKNPILWYDPAKTKETFAFIKKYVNRMCSDFYLVEEPKSFTTTNYFSFSTGFKAYRPKLHKSRNPWDYNPIVEVTEFLTCECGGTTWAFADKTVKHRPEIVLRKARYRYPRKFDF
jgi:hypothetical protein